VLELIRSIGVPKGWEGIEVEIFDFEKFTQGMKYSCSFLSWYGILRDRLVSKRLWRDGGESL